MHIATISPRKLDFDNLRNNCKCVDVAVRSNHCFVSKSLPKKVRNLIITTSVMVNPIIKKLLSAAGSEKQSNGTVKSVATGRLLFSSLYNILQYATLYCIILHLQSIILFAILCTATVVLATNVFGIVQKAVVFFSD